MIVKVTTLKHQIITLSVCKFKKELRAKEVQTQHQLLITLDRYMIVKVTTLKHQRIMLSDCKFKKELRAKEVQIQHQLLITLDRYILIKVIFFKHRLTFVNQFKSMINILITLLRYLHGLFLNVISLSIIAKSFLIFFMFILFLHLDLYSFTSFSYIYSF